MNQRDFEIVENRPLTADTYRMVLCGDASAVTAPGQFVNIKLPGLYLRRPISIHDWDSRSLTLIYKVLGRGTEDMSRLPVGTVLDLLVGLGNGFDTAKSGDAPLLIGGGVGIAPLYGLAKQLLSEGRTPTVILGFNSAGDQMCVEDFQALGLRVLVTTVDGSVGIPGFVTDAMGEAGKYSYFYTCGPMPMLRAIEKVAVTSGQYSFEERMGCGFGACVGCTCQTKNGPKRVCTDGPVLEREEIIW